MYTLIYILKAIYVYIKSLTNKDTMVDIKKLIQDKIDDKTNKYLESIGYYTAPASSSRHLCMPGGLAVHSYNMYLALCDLNDTYDLELTEDEMIKIGLLHDVCKCDGYVENILTSGKVSEAKPYKVNDTLPIGHGDKSVIMLLKAGIELSDREIIAIRYHMGSFTYADSQQWSIANNMITKAGYWELCMATHIADMIASQLLEGKSNLYTKLYKHL